MIIFLEGVMGSGKTYEAVKYHIIPALLNGRKVITNVPMERNKLAAVYGFQILDLLDVRENKKNEDGTHYIAFDSVEEFKDTWQHPETNQGALYVIDECQIPIPNIRSERTHQLFIEASMQRHSGHDWILITQNIDNVYQPIAKLAQAIHYMRKRLSLGFTKSYFHFVYDGNTKGKLYIEKSVRIYDDRVFLFYKSHTRSDKAVKEQSLNAFTNTRFKMLRMPVLFVSALILYIIYLYFHYSVPESSKTIQNSEVRNSIVATDDPIEPVNVESLASQASQSRLSAQITRQNQNSNKKKNDNQLPVYTKSFVKENDSFISDDVVNILPYEQTVYNRAVITSKDDVKRPPFDTFVIQVKGSVVYEKKKLKEFIYDVYSPNGVASEFKESDLKKIGYTITVISDCVHLLDHPNSKEPVYLTCHVPVFSEDALQNKPISKKPGSFVDSL